MLQGYVRVHKLFWKMTRTKFGTWSRGASVLDPPAATPFYMIIGPRVPARLPVDPSRRAPAPAAAGLGSTWWVSASSIY